MTGFVFSSCKKENKVAEDSPPISNFEEFQARAGDRLVYSEEHSDDEFDCYLYYAGGEGVEPSIIAQAKESVDKGPIYQITCDRWLEVNGDMLWCYGEGQDCKRAGNGAMVICNWGKLIPPPEW